MFTIVYFSPTGNTAYLAKILSEQLATDQVYALEHTEATTLGHAETTALEHTEAAALEPTEHLIIMFAIHAFNAPRPVMRFARSLPMGRFKWVSIIGVGCNVLWVNSAASLEVRKTLKDKHYPILVDEVLAMPLTLVMRFPDALGRAQVEKATQSIQVLAQAIVNEVTSPKAVPLKATVISKIGRVESVAARFFGLELHAKKSCNLCGLCVRSCPEQNIYFNGKGKIRFGFKCLMCLRCIYSCPQKAIAPRLSRFIPIKDGYALERYLERSNHE